MNHLLVEILGWIASVLIVGAYFLNINGKLKSNAPLYIISNLVGGIFFAINTYVHGAYPSVLVNIIWVMIAIAALFKKNSHPSQD
jgi:hypothetical protein